MVFRLGPFNEQEKKRCSRFLRSDRGSTEVEP